MARIHEEADLIFNSIDTNGDGAISEDELRMHLSGLAAYPDTVVESIFNLLDDNSDGSISRNELRESLVRFEDPAHKAAALNLVMEEVRDQKAAELSDDDIARLHAESDAFFAEVDSNGDGAISDAELRAHLATIGYPSAAVDSIFGLLDANADGEISRDELRACFVRYEDPALRAALGLGFAEVDSIFESIDTNGDGAISREELREHLSARGLDAAAADSIFETLDVNADGGVSRDELRDGYRRYSALRAALGLGAQRGAAARSKKKVPVRWGRGGRGAAAASPDEV